MASTREWFETVEEARRRAKRHLPKPVYIGAGGRNQEGVTLQDNLTAFSELRFTPPHIADLPATRGMATSVLGQEIALPVIASPTGVQAVHPDGEAGVARGTAEAGTAMGLSSFGSMPVETVAPVNPKLFFQTYWSGTRDQIIQRTERARPGRRQGPDRHPGLVVLQRQGLGQPADPGEDGPADPAAPRARGHPEGQLRARLAPASAACPTSPPAQHGRATQAGPHVLRGVRRVDADPAANLGRHRLAAPAVGRPLHGQGRHAARRRPPRRRHRGHRDLGVQPRRQQPGRQCRSIRALPGVADAVGGQIEVLFDGGFRRGSNVVKALALGARAVMIGRAYLWGLAANGSAGVKNVFDVLCGGIDSTLLALGRSSIRGLSQQRRHRARRVQPGLARVGAGQRGRGSAPRGIRGRTVRRSAQPCQSPRL